MSCREIDAAAALHLRATTEFSWRTIGRILAERLGRKLPFQAGSCMQAVYQTYGSCIPHGQKARSTGPRE